MVARSIELAMMLRERIDSDPLIGKYFNVLAPEQMILEEYRPSGLKEYFSKANGWGRMDKAWLSDEFVLDPTRVTVHVGRTGLDGDTFKKLLMDKFDIADQQDIAQHGLVHDPHRHDARYDCPPGECADGDCSDLDDKLDRWSDVECTLHRQRVVR